MNEKYFKIRKDLSLKIGDITIFRIEATRDLDTHDVKKGDIGGYIEKEENLSENAWVSGSAMVYGDARVSGSARVSGDARVYGSARVSGSACVSGDAWVYGSACVYGDARVSGSAMVYGDARVSGSACVYGDARVSGDAWVEKRGDCINIADARYNITILTEHMQIGCQFHQKQEWWGYSDREIIALDGKDGLKWWKKWKTILQAICSEMEIENER